MTLNEGGMDNGNNLYVRDLTKPNSQFIQMCSDTRFRYSTVETVGKKMYILTNAGAPKYRLMVADVDRPGYNDWKEVVPEGESVLTDVTFAADRMILQYSKDNCNQMYTYTTDGKPSCRHSVLLQQAECADRRKCSTRSLHTQCLTPSTRTT